MLRVLVLSRDLRFHGGVEEFVRVLSARMKDGVRVELFPVGRRREAGRGLPLVQPFRDAFRLRRTVLRGGCDLVHLNPTFRMTSLLRDGLFSFFQRSTPNPVLVMFHGALVKSVSRVVRFRLFRGLFKMAFKKAAALVVPTEAVRKLLVGAGFAPEQVHVLGFMFEGHAFQDAQFCESHLARRTGETMLFYGKFEKDEGSYEVIKAFARMKKGMPDLKLVMAGEGPEEEALIQLAKDLGVNRDVGFPGVLSGRDRAALFLTCDVFVLPTSRPGCPPALLEAMAAGCGVVTTSVEGIEEVVEPGVNGIVLHETDEESTAKAVTRILRDKESLAEMQKVNSDAAFTKYETKVVLDGVRSIYMDVTGTVDHEE